MVPISAKGFDHTRTVSGPPTEILDQIPTPIWRAGPDFLCDYVNRAWLSFTGRTLDQELGRGWLEGIHPEDRDRTLAVVFDGFHKRVPFTVEFRVRRYDGMYRWVGSTGDVSVDPDGSFSGYIGSCFDIHERKQAEEELRQAKEHIDAVLSNAPITIFVLDKEGVFTLSEGAGLKAVGLKPGENVGVSALDLYTSLPVIEQTGNVTTGGDMIRRVLAGETITGITELRGRYFENRFVPFRGADGDVIGLVGVATDVTARRQAEAALAEDRSRLQSFSRRLVEAQETERRHVARELHDEIGQTLTAVKIAIQSLCLEPALDNFS
jgi:PAS domain S-box-containing protein